MDYALKYDFCDDIVLRMMKRVAYCSVEKDASLRSDPCLFTQKSRRGEGTKRELVISIWHRRLV